MSTSSFHLRNMTPEMMSLLKKEAGSQNISVNTLILQIIGEGIGTKRPTKKTVYNDLDHLAGTWSQKDQKAFEENVKPFEAIEKDLWK